MYLIKENVFEVVFVEEVSFLSRPFVKVVSIPSLFSFLYFDRNCQVSISRCLSSKRLWSLMKCFLKEATNPIDSLYKAHTASK